MPSLNDLDPDVLRLYQDLMNNKYESCDDYLVSPVEEYNRGFCNKPLKQKDIDIYFDGLKINDFYESYDDISYGL